MVATRPIGEYLAPFAEWLIGGDQQGAALVAAADQLEQHAGFGLILPDIGDVVEDEQVILVELGDRAFEAEFTARDLQALDEFAGRMNSTRRPFWTRASPIAAAK